jgi:hypothetical protein
MKKDKYWTMKTISKFLFAKTVKYFTLYNLQMEIKHINAKVEKKY